MQSLARLTIAVLLLSAGAAWAQIKVGATLSLTGPAASLGIPERDTIALLPKEIADIREWFAGRMPKAVGRKP